MDGITMEEPLEFLVNRRSRRSTAGNRMEAALAEMALDDCSKDVDDDNEFANEKDEEDIFGSDFESTDEEADQDGAVTGETEIQEEERRARKVTRSRFDKVTAAAYAKHSATFNPQANSPSLKPKAKVKRRVSLGLVIDAATGKVLEPSSQPSDGKIRQSKRMHTVLNTTATVTRQKKSEEKKAAAPKKAKTYTRSYTQMELIARALDNEEGNIVEHRNYLKLEEEKRKRARVIRATVEGPLLRWVSKFEEVDVKPQQPLLSPPTAPTTVISTNTFTPMPNVNETPSIINGYATLTNPFPVFPPLPSPQIALPFVQNITIPEASTPTSPSATPTVQMNNISQLIPQPESLVSKPNLLENMPTDQNLLVSAHPPNPSPIQPQAFKEQVAKNYVIHELAQYGGISKPSWLQTMSAMFGDHVKWDEIKVYVGKGRPLSRVKHLCPITGKLALYYDPRTGVPYADVHAFKVLSQLLHHEYLWSSALGCYVGKPESGPQISSSHNNVLSGVPT